MQGGAGRQASGSASAQGHLKKNGHARGTRKEGPLGPGGVGGGRTRKRRGEIKDGKSNGCATGESHGEINTLGLFPLQAGDEPRDLLLLGDTS